MMTKSKTAHEVQKPDDIGIASDITRRDLLTAAAAFALTASGKVKPMWEGAVPSKVLDMVDSFGEDTPADRHALLEAASLAGIIIASMEPIEDIESTLPVHAKRLADLFSCREKVAINLAVNGKHEHTPLTPAQVAEVNEQEARRRVSAPTNLAKAFGVSMADISRQMAGQKYGA